MKKTLKRKMKRLIADIPPDLHHAVKTRALKKNMTIREWLSFAITEQIRKEMIEEI